MPFVEGEAAVDAAQDSSVLSVVFAADRQYALPLLVALFSLYKNQNEGTKIKAHIIESGDFPEHYVQIIDAMAERFAMPEPYHIAPRADYDDVNLRIEHTSQATYYRLDLPDLLPDVDICLYLDCDVLVASDVSSLFSIAMDDTLLVGVKAAAYYYPVEGQAEKARVLGINGFDQYVNAGVLLMNLELMREREMVDGFRPLIDRGFNSQDQDILNAACYGSIKTVSPAFNLMSKYHPADPRSFENDPCLSLVWTKEEWADAVANPVIIHYADDVKPWNSFLSDETGRWWDAVSEMEDMGFSPRLADCLFPDMGLCDSLREKLASKTAEVADFRGAYAAMKEAYATVKDDHTHLKGAIKDLKGAIRDLEAQNVMLMKTIDDMHASRTWRVGSAMMAPFRWLRRSSNDDAPTA